ncbi:hypothetical protein ACPA9J_02320 [Pseudomonas aeruginosa]
MLYNAFGQRLISTIYTQATQYRVVLGGAAVPARPAGPGVLLHAGPARWHPGAR